MTDLHTILTGEPIPARIGIVGTQNEQGRYNFGFTLNVPSGGPRVNIDIDASGMTGGLSSLNIYEDATLVGSRAGIDFVDSPTITFQAVDDSLNNKVIITATTTGSGLGDVTGPSSSIDNRIVRFDGTTGKLIQSSHALLNDNGVINASGIIVTAGHVSGAYLSSTGGANILLTTTVQSVVNDLNNWIVQRTQGFSMASTYPVNWSSTSEYFGTKDIGIVRQSSGILKITNGFTGLGGLYLGADLTNASGLTIQAAASQTSPITRWINSAGSTLGAFDGNGYFSANRIGVGTNAPDRSIQVVGGSIRSENGFYASAAGANSSPSFRMVGANGTMGFYSTGTNNLMILATAASDQFGINNNGSGVFKSDGSLSWSSTSSLTGAIDSIVSRKSAGVLKINFNPTTMGALEIGQPYASASGLVVSNHGATASGPLTVWRDYLGNTLTTVASGGAFTFTSETARQSRNNMLPTQSISSGLFLKTDGTNVAWGTPSNGYWINVKDYGATGDGATDDSLAFSRAVDAVWARVTTVYGLSTGYRGIAPTLYIPYGKYLIGSSGVLTPPTGTGTSIHGFRIIGDGMNGTQIIYTANNGGYLCDGANRLSNLSIEDITFTGSGTQKAFLLADTNGQGRTASSFWKKVLFTNFKEAITFSGSYISSENKFFGCGFDIPESGFGVTINNLQSLNHDFYSCDFSPANNAIGLNLIAGGAVRFFGGSHIPSAGSGLLLSVGNGNNGINNEMVNYYGTRFELPESTRMLSMDTAVKTVVYDGVSITNVVSSSITHMNIRAAGKVSFINSSIASNFRAKIETNLDTAYFSNSYIPAITFDNCQVNDQFATMVTITSYAGNSIYDGSYGRVSANNCWNYSSRYDPVDVSIYADKAADSRTNPIKYHYWSSWANNLQSLPGGVSNVFSSGLMYLPQGAIVRKIGIERVNQSGTYGTQKYTHNVYNYDRSKLFVFCSGIGAHEADQVFWSDDLYYKVDSSAKRLFQILGSGTTGGVETGVGGKIIVEYY